MGAPTWPPTPEDARRAVLEEYGEDARAVLDDEEAERAILAPFLFSAPPRMLWDGDETVGTPLDGLRRSLEAWLRMLTGRTELCVGVSDPPATDGRDVYLPAAAPARERPAEDALFFRAAALVQAGLLHFRLLENRRLLAEIHRDWVLRSCYHLLALRHVVRRWSAEWPGTARDFAGVAALDKATGLRVNLTEVPTRGMPEAFRPLYEGLVALVEPAGRAGDAARAAVAAVEAIDRPEAAVPVLLGQARRLRLHFRELRLGPPPVPRYAGILRPEWLLEDLAAEMRAANEWREGPRPLRLLRRAMRENAARRRGGLLGRFARAPEAPPPEDLLAQGTAPPPEDEGHRYEEWDGRALRVGAVRVHEVEAPAGPLESWERVVRARSREIALVRRRFAALRLEERWLHGQRDGSDLDLDRVVIAMADLAAGQQPRDDLHVRFQRDRRAVAVLVLVDLSGSTEGNVIRLEREALVVLAEGLDALAFPWAIAGFSSHGRNDCRFARIKGFDERLDDAARRRAANLRAGGATRLGAFRRHASAVLSRRPEARKVLLVLSDGRPHDPEGYTGEAAVADSALAVRALRRRGTFVHCVSLDTHEATEAALRAVFGPGRYLLLERVDALPERLPEVLRGLVQ